MADVARLPGGYVAVGSRRYEDPIKAESDLAEWSRGDIVLLRIRVRNVMPSRAARVREPALLWADVGSLSLSVAFWPAWSVVKPSELHPPGRGQPTWSISRCGRYDAY